MLKAGDCILIETNHDRDGALASHVFVICLEPEEHGKQTIIVQINTIRNAKHDKTTILRPGDHEFITKTSYINYSRARVISTINLEQLIEAGKAKRKTPIGLDILDKIREGIQRSAHTPEEVRIAYGYFIMQNLGKPKSQS